MIFKVKKGVFFAELPDRTHGRDPISWGFLFDDEGCELVLGNEYLTKTKVSPDEINEAQISHLLRMHVKNKLDSYDRMNEIFNLQTSRDNRNRILRADPRRARTFLATVTNAQLGDIYIKTASVDGDFSQVENLVDGTVDIFPDAHLYLLNIKTVSPLVCYYVSGLLTIIDRLRMVQEELRSLLGKSENNNES